MTDEQVGYGDSPGSIDAETPIGAILDELAFDEEAMFLTRRQAVVLAMRERGNDQGSIAHRMDCSRANVSNIERSARDNIEKARKTLSFAKVLSAPVRVELPADLPLHEVPERIYERCDEADVKVNHGAPDLFRKVAAASPNSEDRGTLADDVIVKITSDGEIHVLGS